MGNHIAVNVVDNNYLCKIMLIYVNLCKLGEKPYSCEHCGMSFIQKGQLQYHQFAKHTPNRKRHECQVRDYNTTQFRDYNTLQFRDYSEGTASISSVCKTYSKQEATRVPG